ncbi:MAG: FAD-dependent oxidoreductase [Pirellulaceae bacterium]|nr:FAD-dependent oxidoreductase [Pirellulaceae bacterium]
MNRPHTSWPLASGIVLAAVLLAASGARAETVYVEAESFAAHGGWSLDTAIIHLIGSPYLLAHGMGRPVDDATTTVEIPRAGTYRIWVRTKDWVAPWKAPGAPGRFQLLVNGAPVKETFGTEGADWHWQAGGELRLAAGPCQLALHDLTGFDGRCDAVLLSSDERFAPPEGEALAAARRQWLGLPERPEDAGPFDLVVVGGGYSGLGAAISAARQSLRVALVQDRFVLGGNGSSEVRVWANGGTMRGKYPHLGEIVEEFADHAPDSPGLPEQFGDELKEQVCRREKTLRLFLGHFAHAANTDPLTGKIVSVTALEVRTGRERVFRAPLFVDCTGHGTIGALAGADFHIEPSGRMGMSNMWYWQTKDSPQPWPETPWALPLELKDFPATAKSRSVLDGRPFMKGEWFWESGFDKDSIQDLELIRDWNLRAAFGAFSAMKHGPEREKYANAAFQWIAYVGGPRESRLLRGDLVLSREDIVSQREFPDGTVPTTWDIDLHYPKQQYAEKFADNPFISRAEFGAGVDRQQGYPLPYRCFYSRNVPNLFMAGRCISVTHEALGTIRVMRTCGMMGEVVGKAAYLCVLHDTTPRGIYERYLSELLELVQQPGAMRRVKLDGPLLRDTTIGQVRPYLTKATDTVTGVPEQKPRMIGVSSLPGIVVDDRQARLTGPWSGGGGLTPFVGDGYLYAAARSAAEARFEFEIPRAGKYEVRLAWVGHENRGSRVPCTIERSGQQPLKLRIDQREELVGESPFHVLGQFDFAQGPAAIVLSAAEANGFVHADAVQVVEVK